jgi:hypothetical protein
VGEGAGVTVDAGVAEGAAVAIGVAVGTGVSAGSAVDVIVGAVVGSANAIAGIELMVSKNATRIARALPKKFFIMAPT